MQIQSTALEHVSLQKPMRDHSLVHQLCTIKLKTLNKSLPGDFLTSKLYF